MLSYALIKIPALRYFRITKIIDLSGGPSHFFLSYVLELQISSIEKTEALMAILCPGIEKLCLAATKSCFDYCSFSPKYFSSK